MPLAGVGLHCKEAQVELNHLKRDCDRPKSMGGGGPNTGKYIYIYIYDMICMKTYMYIYVHVQKEGLNSRGEFGANGPLNS